MSLSNVKTVISTLTITIHGNGDVIYPDELEDTINEKNTPPDITDSSKEKNFNLTISTRAPCGIPLLCDDDTNVDETYDVFGLEYHGLLLRSQVNHLLKGKADGTYLVSKTLTEKVILSLNFNNTIMNYTIKVNDTYFIYGGKEYETIHELVSDCLILLYSEKPTETNYKSYSLQHNRRNTYSFSVGSIDELEEYEETCPTILLSPSSPFITEPPASPFNEPPASLIDDTSDLDDIMMKNAGIVRGKETILSGILARKKSDLTENQLKRCYSTSSLTSEKSVHFREKSKPNELSDFVLQKSQSLGIQKSATILYKKSHNFRACVFKVPSWCDRCHHLLFGLTIRHHCRDCGINVHGHCLRSTQNYVECLPNRKTIKKVFGIDLTALVMVELNVIPMFIEQCATAIEMNTLETEGLYRKSSTTSKVLELKRQFDEGKQVDLSDIHEVHVITGAIKLFFRELPIPLITYDAYPNVIQAVKDHPNDIDEFCSTVKQILSNELPKSHYDTLSFFIQHLQRVASCSYINKMDSRNLAVVFAPTLMRSPTDDSILNLANLQYEQKFIERLITYADDVL